MGDGIKLAASVATATPTDYPAPPELPPSPPKYTVYKGNNPTDKNGGRIKIVVTPFINKSMHPLTVADVEQAVNAFLAKHEELDVLNYKDFEEVLGFDEVDRFIQCKTDVSCLAELGAHLGFDRLVTGVVDSSEGGYRLDLMMINTQQVQLEQQEGQEVLGGKEKMIEVADILTTRFSLHLLSLLGVLPLPSITVDSNKMTNPSFVGPHSNHQKLKWGGLVAGGGVLLLAVGAAFMSQSWAEIYNSQRNDLKKRGMIISSENGRETFRDLAVKEEYHGQLDDLKSASERDATIANVGFVVSGIVLGVSAWLFYSDSQDEMR